MTSTSRSIILIYKIIAYADDSVIFTSSKGLDAIQHNLSEDTIASPLGSEITNLSLILKKEKLK